MKNVMGQTSPFLTYNIKYNYIDTLQDLAFSEHQLGVIFATSVLKPKIFKIYWPKITKLQLQKTQTIQLLEWYECLLLHI